MPAKPPPKPTWACSTSRRQRRTGQLLLAAASAETIRAGHTLVAQLGKKAHRLSKRAGAPLGWPLRDALDGIIAGAALTAALLGGVDGALTFRPFATLDDRARRGP
jgi:hypothetical protein